MPKCIDCENLLQLYVRRCGGTTKQPKELSNGLEFLSTFDFVCECDYNKTPDWNQIKEERECSDFEPIETNSATQISDRDYAEKFGRLP